MSLYKLHIIPEDYAIVNDLPIFGLSNDIQFALMLGFEEMGNLESTKSCHHIANEFSTNCQQISSQERYRHKEA